LYQQTLRRLNPQSFLTWPTLLLRIDAAIKGLSQEKPEHIIQQCIAELCGKSLFIND
jgi:DNA polymerase-3 subunit delta